MIVNGQNLQNNGNGAEGSLFSPASMKKDKGKIETQKGQSIVSNSMNGPP